MTAFCFVLDSMGTKLAPTNANKAGYLIRKGRAKLVSKAPMVIQLNREVLVESTQEVVVGVDTGSKETGIALVLVGSTKNKPIFKGTIKHRQDVSKRMKARKGYRRYRRSYKRYRKPRFNNRAASRRKGRIPPSIKTNKDEILRVINNLSRYINITKVVIEDVKIDIKAIQLGYKPYSWQYQEPTRLDENLRIATLMRDNYSCQECGVTGTLLEAHHIIPKRLRGANTLSNLITLCHPCHEKVTNREENFIQYFQSKIGGRTLRFDYAQHSMQGKTYLRNQLSKQFQVELTTGGDTSNKRKDWNIAKTHSNDALVICGKQISTTDIYDYRIEPLRKKSKANDVITSDIKQRDIVFYVRRNKQPVLCKVIAILKSGVYKGKYNLKDFSKNRFGPVSRKSLKLVWRFKSIIFI